MWKYIVFFCISLALSSLLLSIEWFTWQAWIFVSVYMTIQYWFQMCRSSDMYAINVNMANKLNSLYESMKRTNGSIDNLNNLMFEKMDGILNKTEKIRKILLHES